MDNRIAERINDIKNDKLHGAAYLSQQAISTLIIAVTDNPSSAISELIDETNEVSSALKAARPTMISITNNIIFFIEQIQAFHKPEIDAITFKNMVKHLGNEIIHEMERAAEKAAGYGADVINDGDTILTCSFSSLVCKTIVTAKNRGNNVNIFISESRWSNMDYGKLMAQELKKQAISSIIIHDRDITKYLHKTTKALTGADCILTSGAVVNGVPSLNIARAISSEKLRYYVICETAKFDTHNFKGTDNTIEEGFDIIPPELITGLITEKGIISPTEIRYFLSSVKTKSN